MLLHALRNWTGPALLAALVSGCVPMTPTDPEVVKRAAIEMNETYDAFKNICLKAGAAGDMAKSVEIARSQGYRNPGNAFVMVGDTSYHALSKSGTDIVFMHPAKGRYTNACGVFREITHPGAAAESLSLEIHRKYRSDIGKEVDGDLRVNPPYVSGGKTYGFSQLLDPESGAYAVFFVGR